MAEWTGIDACVWRIVAKTAYVVRELPQDQQNVFARRDLSRPHWFRWGTETRAHGV